MKPHKPHIAYSLLIALSLAISSCTSYENLLAVDDSYSNDGIYSNRNSGYGYFENLKNNDINNIAGDPSLGLYNEVDESYNAYLENNYFNGEPEKKYSESDSASSKDLYYSEENRSNNNIADAYNSGYNNYYSPFRFNISMMFGYGAYPPFNPYYNPFYNPYYYSAAFYDPFNSWMYPGYGWGYPMYAWGPGGIYYPPLFIPEYRPQHISQKRSSRGYNAAGTDYTNSIKYEYKRKSTTNNNRYTNKSETNKANSGYYNKYRNNNTRNNSNRNNSYYQQDNGSSNYNQGSYTPSSTRSRSSSGNTNNSSSGVRRKR